MLGWRCRDTSLVAGTIYPICPVCVCPAIQSLQRGFLVDRHARRHPQHRSHHQVSLQSPHQFANRILAAHRPPMPAWSTLRLCLEYLAGAPHSRGVSNLHLMMMMPIRRAGLVLLGHPRDLPARRNLQHDFLCGPRCRVKLRICAVYQTHIRDHDHRGATTAAASSPGH